MEKKKMKKLSLKKEEIVNLNDYEMSDLKGGYTSSAQCIYASVTLVTAIVSYGQDTSWYACEHSKQKDCMGDISRYFAPDGSCLLPDIEITP